VEQTTFLSLFSILSVFLRHKGVDMSIKLAGKGILILVVVFAVWVLVQNAWIGDDGFITMRVIENLVAGYGPNFNVGERVQVYTHPLWMFWLGGEYYLLRHLPIVNFIPLPLYYLIVFTSLLLSISTIVLYSWKVASDWRPAVFGILVLSFSRSFVHYSTSGLENPLFYLILMIFLYFALIARQRAYLLSLLVSLAVLTRQDNLLLFIPFLFYLLITSNSKKRTAFEILAGLSPVVFWEIFSIFYYGFPFPNTAYAKLNTGLDRFVLLKAGLVYFQDLWLHDRITFVTIASALVVALFSKQRSHHALAAGIALYLGYILWIGGDFMSGRFFSAPLVLSVCLLTSFEKIRPTFHLWLGVAAVFVGFLSPYPPVVKDPRISSGERAVFIYADQITDYRAFSYARMGLLVPNKYYLERRFPRPERWVFHPAQYDVKMYNDLGVKGYSAGPSVHVFDFYALSDPLLARLPCNPNSAIGHYMRAIPAGYDETLYYGDNQIADPSLAIYYDKLQLITSGDLFDSERLIEIINMNLGKYDYLIDEYLQRNRS
jgi:arabinofuranosyltransferase